MLANYAISLATLSDVAGILTLQEPNLPDNGGNLSVRQPADWFKRAVGENSLIVARRNVREIASPYGRSSRDDVRTSG